MLNNKLVSKVKLTKIMAYIGEFTLTTNDLLSFESFYNQILTQIDDDIPIEESWYKYAKRIDNAVFLDDFKYSFQIVEYEDDDTPIGLKKYW